MPTKKQHFVPRVYMKAWETTVETLKDPHIKFSGVYTFEDHTVLGNGANRNSVLWMPHLYTVRFQHNFVCRSCPRIMEDFVNQIYTIMRENGSKPIYAKIGYSVIRTKKSIRKHLHEIDDWTFYYEDGNLAKQAAIQRNINALNSYVLENAFDDYWEKKWDSVQQGFIDAVRNSLPAEINSSERLIPHQLAFDMLSCFLMMLCRSPYFTAMGIYQKIKDTILYPMFEDLCISAIPKEQSEITDEDREKAIEEGKQYADTIMTGVWYSELYRMIFGNTGGFYHSIIPMILLGCQMILFETYPNSEHFITSDNPAFEHMLKVTAENTNGFIFPISPTHLLFIAQGSDKFNLVDYRYANNETVRHFNQIIISHKHNLIIADTKRIRTS
jgi:hypothetical protein